MPDTGPGHPRRLRAAGRRGGGVALSADRIVILTREEEDNLPLLDRLRAAGIEALIYPCVATRYRPREEWRIVPGGTPGDYRAWVFTSRRAVRALSAAGFRPPDTVRTLGVVGTATARAVEKILGRRPDITAVPPTGASLAAAVADRLSPGDAVLHVRGNQTTGTLRRGIEERGFGTAEMVVYETAAPDLAPLRLDRPAVFVFASPSAARRCLTVNPPGGRADRYVAVGPTTALWLRGRAAGRVIEADSPTVEDLFTAVRSMLEPA